MAWRRRLQHGRTESLLSLRQEGVDLLKVRGLIDAAVPCDGVTAKKLHRLDHELLANDFRVQLAQMERTVPAPAI